MNCETTAISKKQLSDLFRCHVNTVDAWIKAGLPHRIDKREYRFDLSEVIAWHHNFISGIAENIPSFADARRQKEFYQAELKRLQFEQTDKSLLHREEIVRQWTLVLSGFRNRLLGLPTRLAPQVYGCKTPGEAFSILEKHIHDLLAELSESRYHHYKKGKK